MKRAKKRNLPSYPTGKVSFIYPPDISKTSNALDVSVIQRRIYFAALFCKTAGK
jgi:hypothetical protein